MMVTVAWCARTTANVPSCRHITTTKVSNGACTVGKLTAFSHSSASLVGVHTHTHASTHTHTHTHTHAHTVTHSSLTHHSTTSMYERTCRTSDHIMPSRTCGAKVLAAPSSVPHGECPWLLSKSMGSMTWSVCSCSTCVLQLATVMYLVFTQCDVKIQAYGTVRCTVSCGKS